MKHALKFDHWLLLPVFVLLVIGLTTLYSINQLYLRSQLASLFIACIIFFLFTQVDYHMLKSLKKSLYLIALILLLIVLAIGIESRGAVRWIELFGVRAQLSEFFKPMLSLSLAAYVAEKRQLNFRSFFTLVLLLIPVALLLDLQPDLGNALIYCGVFFLTLIIVGLPIRWFFILFLPLVIASPVFWTFLHEYQRQRILTFLHPHADPLGTSYNSIQALIAVGSGMFFGRGLGEGTQSGLRFLPERQTDFIFATISEEMGFIGSLIIIIAFAFLFYRIYKIFMRSEDTFEKVFLACSFLFLFFQFVLNIGMNIGLLPVVGVTLPFISYGGSSLISSFIFLAITSAISVSQKKRNVLEIK